MEFRYTRRLTSAVLRVL